VLRPVLAAGVLALAAVAAGTDPRPAAALGLGYLSGWMVLGPGPATAPGRRTFLCESALILGGASALVALHYLRPLVYTLATRNLFPFRAPRGLPIAGVTSLVTPVSDFYLMDRVLEYPALSPGGWRLAVEGAVARPLDLDLDSLIARSRTHRYVTLECVDNPVGGSLMSTALWSGVLVKDLLRDAGGAADIVLFHAADGYVEGAPRQLLEDHEALVVCGMNGWTLPREHGFPARLVLPGVYGFKSVKWLTRLEVARRSTPGPWSAHGWLDLPEIHTTTRIDVARRWGDQVMLAGIAFAGSRRVSAVQVRVNGGPWSRATLGPAPGRSTWVQWAIRLHGTAPARVEVRAVDGVGQVQSPKRRGPYPAGATGWSTVTV
jgi:DMSO/TMAO reductase YedYZ molybdopterin-dependent catalytic subunit